MAGSPPNRPKLERGDSAPWFHAAALSGVPSFAFDSVAGRHVLMLFMESAVDDACAAALSLISANRPVFDDDHACFFGVTSDPSDAGEGRIATQVPGIRFFLDYDRAVATLYGVADGNSYAAQWVLLDPALRVLGLFPVDRGEEAIALLRREIESAPRDQWAPVLVVPNVFPLDLCQRLIEGYERNGGEPSGFMREVDGKTVIVVDEQHKMRSDWTVEPEALRREIAGHIDRHLGIPIRRAFQFTPSRIERYLVACYEAGAGHFRPHRDNRTKGTSHRRFAVTINLNADDYEGGDLRFPEFGNRAYRAPTGGAIVFSCSLLHEALPVTKGRRFAFLPFLYDEEAARIREANNPHLGAGVAQYRRT